jgi:diaminohydroxyphosphoribosylaminopyrimidine deaminase/5-amino-6-(5-phosphoribosylamino)uracil reductase
MTMAPSFKEQCMRRAIDLARQGRGQTAPNPCVGAVIVQDDHIVAWGWHTKCGRPHAEVEALADARAKNIDMSTCTLFVTLEPCNHTGKTPPCTRAILQAAIPRVVIGTMDPNPHVQGGGADFLAKNGVGVEIGILEQECRDLIADFILWQRKERPYSILKLATTLDGKIATRTGHSAWVSGEVSRARVHDLRSWVGAVIVGGETFRQDNPSLTCRKDGFDGPQPMAVIVTRHLPEHPDRFTLLKDRPDQTIFWTTVEEAGSPRGKRLISLGCRLVPLPAHELGLDLHEGFARLYREHGCYHTLCEGGGFLAMSLLKQDLADEIHLFQAMKILGDEQATPCFSGRKISSMKDALSLRLSEASPCGEDLFLRLMPRR